MVGKQIFALAMCTVLFACAPMRADDTEPKKLALFPIPVVNDEVVGEIKSLGIGEVVRVPMFNALLIRGTDKELLRLTVMLRPV